MSTSSGATWRRAARRCAASSKPSIDAAQPYAPRAYGATRLAGGDRLTAFATYALAALAEIAGCFAAWAVLRDGRSAWWLLPGLACLALFALLLTRIDAAFAGRAFAAYGGVYIAASLGWMWVMEGARPDRWDLAGLVICLAGAALILFAPRAAA